MLKERTLVLTDERSFFAMLLFPTEPKKGYPMPHKEVLERHSEAARPRPEQKGELGFRLVNPDDPPEDHFMVPLDPKRQAHADRYLSRLHQEWLEREK